MKPKPTEGAPMTPGATVEYQVRFGTRPKGRRRGRTIGEAVPYEQAMPRPPASAPVRIPRPSMRTQPATPLPRVAVPTTEVPPPNTQSAPGPRVPNITLLLVLGHHFERLVRDGVVRDYAEIARQTGLTRARVTQITGLTLLIPEIQEAMLDMKRTVDGEDPVHERRLRAMVGKSDWGSQRLVVTSFPNRVAPSERDEIDRAVRRLDTLGRAVPTQRQRLGVRFGGRARSEVYTPDFNFYAMPNSRPRRLTDAQRTALQEHLRRRGLTSVYHFTAAAHLKSIFREGAILCRRELEVRGISYSGHGWGYEGKDGEFQDHVICGFCAHWGMISKEQRVVAVLEIDSALILQEGTIICPGNSASNEYYLKGLQEEDPVQTFEGLFPDSRSNWPTNYQAEVLAYESIPINLVRRVHFPREEHRNHYVQKAREGLRENTSGTRPSGRIHFIVNPAKFPGSFNPHFDPDSDP